jgi:hypothetical protein
VNALYIGVDVGPWLSAGLRGKVCAALLDELTPMGRLKEPALGEVFGAPEPLRALRTAYALRSAGATEGDDSRLRRLRAWLLKQDWTQVRLRPCDVTFLAEIALGSDS